MIETPSELYHSSFKEGDSFGEKAFLKYQPRAGTCIASRDCYCVAVEKSIYMKAVKKLHLELI